MIGFDNGPKDGDFVRYIDRLLATRATTAATAVQKLPSAPADVRRSAPSSIDGANRLDAKPSPRATPLQGNAMTPAQAGAVAAAMFRRDGDPGPRSWIPLVAVVVGAVLMVAGWVGATFTAPLVLVGGVLVYWALKRLVAGGAPPLPTAPTRRS